MTSAAARCLDPICLDGPTEDEPAPRFADDGSNLCRRCGQHLERRIAEMPSQATALRAVLGGLSSSQRGENRPTKGTPPVPLNIGAHDHLTAMHAVLVSWVLLVTEERSLRGPDRGDVPGLSAWLMAQVPWLLGHPAVGDLADEVRDLTRIAEGMTQAKEQWHNLGAPCPDCSAQEMGRWDGDSQVHCRSCGRSWDEDEYPRMVHVVACDTRHSITAAEAVDIAGIKPDLFRQWVRRHGIRKLGTAYGVTRYSADDLDAVLRRRDEGAA